MDVNEPAPKSKLPLILLAVFGGGAVLIVASIGVLGYLDWNALKEQAAAALGSNPVIKEHIGTIQSLTIDLVETGATEGDHDFVYRVRGSRGSGVVTARLVTIDAETGKLVGGQLHLSDDRVFSLFPED